MADNLTDQETKHWTGTDMPMHGLARIDGVNYRWMGRDPRLAPAMQQSGLHVTPTQTEYTFQAAGVRLQARFFHLQSRPISTCSHNPSLTLLGTSLRSTASRTPSNSTLVSTRALP